MSLCTATTYHSNVTICKETYKKPIPQPQQSIVGADLVAFGQVYLKKKPVGRKHTKNLFLSFGNLWCRFSRIWSRNFKKVQKKVSVSMAAITSAPPVGMTKYLFLRLCNLWYRFDRIWSSICIWKKNPKYIVSLYGDYNSKATEPTVQILARKLLWLWIPLVTYKRTNDYIIYLDYRHILKSFIHKEVSFLWRTIKCKKLNFFRDFGNLEVLLHWKYAFQKNSNDRRLLLS